MIDGHGDDIHNHKGIRMNFSSNIYPHAYYLQLLEEHLCAHIRSIRSYPEPSPRSLEAMIAEKHGISPDEVLVTNGATDAIYLIAQAFREKGTFTFFPPTFAEYEDACRIFNYKEVDDGFLCWLCNPNNPTGEAYPISHIEALAAKHDLLVLDQSYEDYTLAPMLSPEAVVSMDNVLQLHSMTKQYAIPGLRVGYVVGASPLIRTLRDNIRPWSVNSLAIEGAKYMLRLNPPIIHSLYTYLEQTQWLRSSLVSCAGIDCVDTQTNFFLCAIHPHTATELKDYLVREHGILIRDASNFRGLTPHHFRIAAQYPEENSALVEAIKEYTKLKN